MKNRYYVILAFVLSFSLAGCASNQKPVKEEPKVELEEPKAESSKTSVTAPPREQDKAPEAGSTAELDDAGYRVKPLSIGIEKGRAYLPVGAEIITREGKSPLTEVIKKLGELKGYSISWADDVDQTQPVDVHIRPEDNFWSALDNILRQLDYYYEVREDTIIVKYKETRRYHLSMPALTETMTSSLGGNMLPSGGSGDEEITGVEAQVNLEANSEEFNFWEDVGTSLEQIVDCEGCPAPVINSSLGMITVSAPRRIHGDVENYLTSLKDEAYKQVVIEAKILEVILRDDQSTGIDWSEIFGGRETPGTEISGTMSFAELNPSNIIYSSRDIEVGKLIRDITVNPLNNLSIVVSAFNQYGDTRIIANPKVHILNGHGAVLSAGRQRQYLSGCETTESEAGNVTAQPELDSVTEGLTIGIKANIITSEEVILYVFPAITRLLELRDVGEPTQCGTIQAPETAIREMATFAKVHDNQVLVIGGLISKEESEGTHKLPILGDIPLAGKLFREDTSSKASTELVILLKPRILALDDYKVRVEKVDEAEGGSSL